MVLALSLLTPAFGIRMPDYDLTSLVILSRGVLLVERFERKGTPGETWCRVKKVYLGPFLEGDQFPLPVLDSYYLPGINTTDAVEGQAAHEPWDKEMLLFIGKGSEEEDATKAQEISLVLSGVKLLSRARVFRCIQTNNPGSYEPFPQERELPAPDDVVLDPPGSAVKFADFEKDLARAFARVARLESARASHDSNALLGLLGPHWETPVFGGMREWSGSLSDAFTPAVLQALFPGAMEATVLEAASRCQSLEFGSVAWPLTEEPLLQVAKDASAPLHHRIAALRLLFVAADIWKTQDHRLIAPILRDPVAEIRLVAAN